ncbi:MAG: PH domain-containing protein [Propioniciclava sp.]
MTEQPPPPDVPLTPAQEPALAREKRLHPLTPIVRMWIGVVAVGGYTVSSVLSRDPAMADVGQLTSRMPWWFWLVGAGVLVALVANYWSWWTTRYLIDEQELRLENRGAFAESQRIAFSRVQSVDLNQPFAARILGLAELSIDVGAESSTRLGYLSRGEAVRLRDYLMARAHGRSDTSVNAPPTASAWDDLDADDQILIRLTAADLLLGAAMSLEFVGLLIALSVPVILTRVFDAPLIAAGGGAIPILLALAGFLSTRVFGQFRYTLARTSAGLRISRGLFTLTSQTIPAYRVQSLQLRQPFGWRLINRGRLDVGVLGNASDGEDATSTVLLPIGRPHQIQTALAAVWPALRLDAVTFTPPPRRARWLDPFAHRWMGHTHDALVVLTRSGWLHRRQTMIPHARLQSVQLAQGPLLRRMRLASVSLHPAGSAFGQAAIEHIDERHARELVFTEMTRARTVRAAELLDPPGLRADAPLLGTALDGADLWALPSALAEGTRPPD